jgi:hypothetical protein
MVFLLVCSADGLVPSGIVLQTVMMLHRDKQCSKTSSFFPKVGAQMFFEVRKSQIRKLLGPIRNSKFENF